MSDKIQRWALMGLDLVESDRGSWCKYYDVAPLEARIEKLESGITASDLTIVILDTRIAEQADELKIAEQGRIALRSKITEQAAEIERLNVMIRSDAMDSRNLSHRIEELEAKIAEQAAEIERLKAANEGWHRRVMEFGPEKESYQQRIEELEVENKSLKGVSVLDRLGNALEQVGIYQQRVINLKEKITQHNLELELTRKVARDRIAELELEIKRLRVELTREIK